jgi:CRISPR-associated exonuclease Cas4
MPGISLMPSANEAPEPIVAISALQHYSYCPRQCGLIHLEQSFDENIYTLRGQALHERVDEPGTETRPGVIVERALPIWSEELGLIGRADAVEFDRDDENDRPTRIYPVEYKQGSRHKAVHDDIQVCAQGLCLEEMFGLQVPTGAIFHHGSRRRREVVFDDALRRTTHATIAAVRKTLRTFELPRPVADSRCRHCSLRNSCLPFVVQRNGAPIADLDTD